MTYKFKKDPISGMILVYILMDENHEFKMMLDTGASNTTFDMNALLMAEYPIENIVEIGMAETAGGIIEVDIRAHRAITNSPVRFTYVDNFSKNNLHISPNYFTHTAPRAKYNISFHNFPTIPQHYFISL